MPPAKRVVMTFCNFSIKKDANYASLIILSYFSFLSFSTTFSSKFNTYNGGFLSPLSQWHKVPFGIPYRLQNSTCERPVCSLISLISISFLFLCLLVHPFSIFYCCSIHFFYFFLKRFLLIFRQTKLIFNFIYSFAHYSLVIPD